MRILLSAVLSVAIAAAGQVISLPGGPFQTAVSADGRWVFVSLTGGPSAGVAVLENNGGTVELRRTGPVKGGLTGLVLTHDGKLLIGTDGRGVVLLDVKRLTTGTKDDAIAGVIHEVRAQPNVVMKNGSKPPDWLVERLSSPGSVYVNVTRDDRFAFVSNEHAASITVIDLQKARSGNKTAIVGSIPVGIGPIALRFSKDERWLYSTSQIAVADWKWPAVCDPEDANGKAGKHAEGAVVVIDVGRSRTDPEHAVVTKVPAGCNPVRLALSPDGERVYVTARGSHALLVFNTGALTVSPSNAQLGKVPVGTSPVPVIAIGQRVIVGNSNRFGSGNSGTLSVVDAVLLDTNDATSVKGTVESGAFPRDLTLAPDGQTLYLANFGSRTLQVLDAGHLQITPVKDPPKN